jgi:serine/threonine protein kinase
LAKTSLTIEFWLSWEKAAWAPVYRAEDLILHREVALKFLPPRFATDPEARARLLREAQTASRLNHPNISIFAEFFGSLRLL